MSALSRIGKAFVNPLFRLGSAYDQTARKKPFTTGVLTTVVKTSLADIFAQKVIEQRTDIDWKRNSLFSFFGFAYLGCFQYWLYNSFFVRICKPITKAVGHIGAAPVKTFIDQCIHHPLIYFPAFYLLKGGLEGKPMASSLTRYREDLLDNCKALWMVWVPAQLFNFSIVPLHLRIPFVAGVSFAWTVIISVMRGAWDAHEDPAEIPLKQMHPGPQPSSEECVSESSMEVERGEAQGTPTLGGGSAEGLAGQTPASHHASDSVGNESEAGSNTPTSLWEPVRPVPSVGQSVALQ